MDRNINNIKIYDEVVKLADIYLNNKIIFAKEDTFISGFNECLNFIIDKLGLFINVMHSPYCKPEELIENIIDDIKIKYENIKHITIYNNTINVWNMGFLSCLEHFDDSFEYVMKNHMNHFTVWTIVKYKMVTTSYEVPVYNPKDLIEYCDNKEIISVDVFKDKVEEEYITKNNIIKYKTDNIINEDTFSIVIYSMELHRYYFNENQVNTGNELLNKIHNNELDLYEILEKEPVPNNYVVLDINDNIIGVVDYKNKKGV